MNFQNIQLTIISIRKLINERIIFYMKIKSDIIESLLCNMNIFIIFIIKIIKYK